MFLSISFKVHIFAWILGNAACLSKDILKNNVDSRYATASSADSLSDAVTRSRCRRTYKTMPKHRLARLIDASGKPSSGLFGRDLAAWYGSYSECEKESNSKYCWTMFPGEMTLVKNKTNKFLFEWGVCVPDTCGTDYVRIDLPFLLNNISNIEAKPSSRPLKVECSEDPEYSSGVVLTIIFCGIIIGLCFLASIMDIIRNYLESQPTTIVENGDAFTMDKTKNENTPLLADVVDNVDKSQKKSSKLGLGLEILDCFSCIRNIKSIMNTNVGKSDLTYLHGIRVWSLFWIIYLHLNWQLLLGFTPIENRNEFDSLNRRFANMVSTSGAFGVDTFLVLSGLLVVYVNLIKREKNNGETNWFLFFFHRFWRLTPSYMFVILFIIKIKPLLGSGPVWFTQMDTSVCSDNWWRNLLYINNFDDLLDICNSQTWYLAVDMQFFSISPIFMYIACRYGFRSVTFLTSIVLLGSAIITAAIIGDKDLNSAMFISRSDPLGTKEAFDYFKYVYNKPYCRIPSYVLGMTLGYVLFKYASRKFYFSGLSSSLLWLIATAVAIALVYGPYNATKEDRRIWTTGERVVYGSTKWILWSMCIVWVIFSCHYGYAGFVKNILSARFWIPLSKINYAAFLVHTEVMAVFLYNIETPIHYTAFTTVTHYTSFLVVIYAAAFILTVFIELPCANLEMLVIRKLTKK